MAGSIRDGSGGLIKIVDDGWVERRNYRVDDADNQIDDRKRAKWDRKR